MEKFGEEKYVATVKWANETIAKSEARRKDSEERAKLLDEECDELLEKLNVSFMFKLFTISSLAACLCTLCLLVNRRLASAGGLHSTTGNLSFL